MPCVNFVKCTTCLPRGVRLAPDDIWDRIAYILSVKMTDPQFSGQTKERLSSRACATFVSGVVKDAFSLWLNQNVTDGEAIATLAISNAQKRMKKSRQVVRKKVTSGPALPGKLADCTSQDLSLTELFLVEGDSAGGSAKQARNREYQAILPLRGKILNTWEVESDAVLSNQEVHDISVAIGVDPGSNVISELRYGKVIILADADSDGLHIATLLCALFLKHFHALVETGHVFRRHATPVSYRYRQGNPLRTGRRRTPGHPGCDRSREKERQDHGNPLQRPGRNEPDAVTGKHRRPGHTPVGAANDRQ